MGNLFIWLELRRLNRSQGRPSAIKGLLVIAAMVIGAYYVAVAGAHLGLWKDGRLPARACSQPHTKVTPCPT